MTKLCIKCEKDLPVESFYANKNGPGGIASYCKECQKLYQRDRRRAISKAKKQSQEQVKQILEGREVSEFDEYMHHSMEGYLNPDNQRVLLHRYGITLAEYSALFLDQKASCKICLAPFEGSPNIDHCHDTGKVRGLLCGPCNKGLGMFKESQDSLLRAILYLRESSS